MSAKRLKILFLHTADSYFWWNRRALANALKDQGFEVVMMAPVEGQRLEYEREGFRVIPWNLSRRNLNPFRELMSFFQVVKVYRRERPDLVHHEALKAVMHGGMAVRFVGSIPSVDVICGLGAVFSRINLKMKILRSIILKILAVVFAAPNNRLIVLNDDNRDLLLGCKIVRPDHVIVSPGIGVNIRRFTPEAELDGVPVVLLPSRMLWEKGVGEFVAAAKELGAKGISARFVLVGAPDPDNPGCVSETQLRDWERSGIVEWWQQRTDMPDVYIQSSIVCLPSYYGEGLPNVLTEAGASGRAVITTSAPGCRQAVEDGVNGLLVPVRSSSALAAAIERLLNDSDLRARLGAAGRERAVREFSQEVIVKQMMGIYRDLLREKWPPADSPASQ